MRLLPVAIATVVLAFAASAQQPAPNFTFDVASIRQNISADSPSSNVPLGPGDVMPASDGILHATGFSLLTYIAFAYKLTDYQERALRDSMPAWVTSDRFNIEARTENRAVTKDQLRQMMQSLLAERFHLAVHYETRLSPVYALKLVKPGATGPKLQPHPIDANCFNFNPARHDPNAPPAPKIPETLPSGFPSICGGIFGFPAGARDRYSFGARNVPMSLIAHSLSSWGNLGRPVLDRTGLTGNYDFVLEFTPDPPPAYAAGVDSGGPSFDQALRQQLGLKLESQKGLVELLVIEHIERFEQN